MTIDLNKAKRLIVTEMNILIEEFDKTDSASANIILAIEEML